VESLRSAFFITNIGGIPWDVGWAKRSVPIFVSLKSEACPSFVSGNGKSKNDQKAQRAPEYFIKLKKAVKREVWFL
jgi:hypothetical protein